MATAHMPEEFLVELEPHLPPEPDVGPRGGRPTVPHSIVMKVIWYVLATGCRWADVPLEIGCSGRTAHRRLRYWEELGIWDRFHVHLLKLLKKEGELDPHVVIVDSVIVRAFGAGEATGPNPVDRRKPGSKLTLLVDKNGVPLAIRTRPANESEHRQLIQILRQFPRVGGASGRPLEQPEELYADRGYDSEAARNILQWLGIEPKIAKRGEPHGSGLGKVRWVVERTISWIKGLRRLRVRYDRSLIIEEAWTTLAAAIVCFRILHHDCCS